MRWGAMDQRLGRKIWLIATALAPDKGCSNPYQNVEGPWKLKRAPIEDDAC